MGRFIYCAPEELKGDAADLELVRQLLLFDRYPGVSRAIFMGAPHHGSPTADRWYARLVRGLAGYRTPELQAVSRVANAQPAAVRDDIRTSYQLANINSISTLQPTQPVRRAGEVLMPAPGIRYHNIAGKLPRTDPASDGTVPLSSAMLDGADSSLVIRSGHDLPINNEAIGEVLRILKNDVATSEADVRR